MSAFRLDGVALSAQLRADFKSRTEALALKGILPGLAVILVGEDPASQVYVRNKMAACLQAGIRSEKFEYPVDILPGVVLSRINSLNADPNVHGILVQLPLPRQFDERVILEAIDPEKDIDGFHAANIGALLQGRPRFIPCTPYGVMTLLESGGIPLRGQEAVIVGRSNIVGKPMALLLMQAGCTVTICHSQTRDLAFHTRRADILVAAMGRPHFIQANMVKPGAVIIDVGINRLPNGKLCGDIDAAAVEFASAYTPVPGGVGPMTITMLLANTLEAAERKTK